MNHFIKSLWLSTALTALLSAGSAFADDTDIYAASTNDANNPNILVLIDNSSNWAANNQGWPVGKQGEAELAALRTAVSQLGPNVNVGLMMFHDGATDGAYIRYAIRMMNKTNNDAFLSQIGTSTCLDKKNPISLTPNCIYKNFNDPLEKINVAGVNYSAAMFEVFKYFGGYTSPANALLDPPVPGSPIDSTHFGTQHYSTLPDDITTGSTYPASAYPVHRYDSAAYTADLTSYVPPTVESCGKNYLIVIGNGYPPINNDLSASFLTGVGGDATQQTASDFRTVSGDVTTPLASNLNFPNLAACEAYAQTTWGALYPTPDPLPYPGFKSLVCTSKGGVTTTVDQGTSTCGEFVSASDCQNKAKLLYPGHSIYSCTATGSCAGTYPIGTSTCGDFSSAANCQASLPALYPDFNSFTCATSASLCSVAPTGLPHTYPAGMFTLAADCVTQARTDYTGYSSYTCTAGTVINNLTVLTPTAEYVSATACATAVASLKPGYTNYACTAPVASLSSSIAHVCGGQNSYDTPTTCNAAGLAKLTGAPYANYTCTISQSQPGNWLGGACSGTTGKYWIIKGFNNTYTATGSGTPWTATGTLPVSPQRYDMSGTGGKRYTITTSDTATLWDITAKTNITTAVPTGNFSTFSENLADEWANFLQKTDISPAAGQQTVTTFTIDVFKDHQDPEQTKLLMNMARLGGGKYFTATNENAIKSALQKIFADIQSVNSVFASSSLPVSVNTQGTYLNQVFMGMFRPKGDATPRWAGNLKQYQFKDFAGILRLADRYGDEAISPTTGFIDPCADSFWSVDTGLYWIYNGVNSKGSCKAQFSKYPAIGSTSAYSDAPDGDIVEKGGAAQRLRGTGLAAGAMTLSTNYSTRKLYTCDDTTTASCTAFTNFNASNTGLTDTDFGFVATSTYTLTDFINWVRGKDVDDERVNNTANEVRPSVHGGVVHSQPAVVDYGGTTGVYAFYGSDDGVLHAVDGGQTDAEGTEAWGFIAPEHYKQLYRQRDNGINTPNINFPNIPAPVAPKDYGFDGGIGVYQRGSTVWIYPSMRRGGRAIYAIGVSDPNSPFFRWRKGCFTNLTSDDTTCDSGWSRIGQTWSKPIVTYLSGYASPVLIFGGGYDTCEDLDSQDRCTTTPRKGSSIWFVDAFTGDPIRTYPTHYSVPGDLTILTDTAGRATHVYAADTGGYVYRVNVGTWDGTTATGWSANSLASDTLIAELSEVGQSRKFLNGPAVVRYAGFNAVLIGSGDREHPMWNSYSCNSGLAGGVKNQYYMLIDKPGDYLAPATASGLTTGLVDVTAGSATFDLATKTITNKAGISSSRGWKFDFSPCEQSVNKGLVIGGISYFGTNTPVDPLSTTACQTNLGIARGYAIDFLTANSITATSPRSAVYTGGGMPPSPVAGVVDMGGTKQPFCIGCIDPNATNSSALQGTPVTIDPAGSRFRSYWYIESD